MTPTFYLSFVCQTTVPLKLIIVLQHNYRLIVLLAVVSLVSITESQLSLNTQDFGAYRSFIIYRDLNPLHNVISEREYKDKYYKGLIPLGVKYAEVSSIN